MKAGHLRPLSNIFGQPRSLPPNDVITRIPPSKPINDLYRRIRKIGDFKVSIVPVLDQWVQEGRPLKKSDLQSFVRELRSYRRYSHALEILTWMTEKRYMKLSSFDHAVHMDLIEKVHGIEKAEIFFNNIPNSPRSFHIYCGLLNCYANAKSVEKAEATMQKMRDLGFALKALSYNHLLNVYRQTRNYEKMDDLMHEMEEKGIDYDLISYSIRLSAYADVSDIHGMDKIVTKMESDPKIVKDWQVYSVLASTYAKCELVDKALLMLKKIEELVPSISSSAYNFLITQYAGMGKKDEVKKLCESYKKKNKVFNAGYKIMISSMLKCDDLEAAEEVFKDWESRDLTYDMMIPNLLIHYYCRKGHLEKAETLVNKLILDEKKPDEKTWFCLATGYVENNQTPEAVDALEKGLSVYSNRFRPYTATLVACLEYLKAKGDTEKAEELIGLLRTKNICSDDTAPS